MFIEIAHAASEAATHEATQGGLLGTFGIDLKLFLAQLLNFAVVVFVLSKWVFKPLMKKMEERKAIVEEGLLKASQANDALRGAKESEAMIIKEARAQAKELVDEGKTRGEFEKQSRVQKSSEIIAQQLKESKDQAISIIEQERSQARAELATLIGLATEKVSKKAIDTKTHRTLIEEAISELEQAHG
jgi:F-type H+-transporting ATPase subunit b